MLIISLRLEVQLLYFVCIYVSTSFVYNDPVSSGELCWLMATLVLNNILTLIYSCIKVRVRSICPDNNATRMTKCFNFHIKFSKPSEIEIFLFEKKVTILNL